MCISIHNCVNVWISNKYAGRSILLVGNYAFPKFLFLNAKGFFLMFRRMANKYLCKWPPLQKKPEKPHFYWIQWEHSHVCACWGRGSRISLFNNLQSCSISPLWITAQSQNKKNEMLFFWICQNTLIPHFHSLISTFQMFVKNSIPSEDVPVSIHQYFWCQHITENFKKIKLFSVTS